jgi:hypothetical protein
MISILIRNRTDSGKAVGFNWRSLKRGAWPKFDESASASGVRKLGTGLDLGSSKVHVGTGLFDADT